MRSALAASVALALCGLSREAAAQSAPRRDVHLELGGSLALDATYLALGGVSTLAGLFAVGPPSTAIAPLDGLGGRPANAAFDQASNVVVGAGAALTVGAGLLLEWRGRGARGWELLRAPLVLSEAVLASVGLVSLVKNLAGECRPRAWDDATARCVGTVRGSPVAEDRLSFPSGHTAPLAALAGAALGMMALPAGGRAAYWPLLLLGAALGASNLVLRVAAGAHNWVDTSVGFGLGLAVGFGTAALHTYARPGRPLLSGGPQGLTVTALF